MVRGFAASLIVLAIPVTGWFACLPNEPALVAWPPTSDSGADSSDDPSVDGGRCATGVADASPFGDPIPVFRTHNGADRRGASLSRDEKTLYFGNANDVSNGMAYPSRLHRARREDRAASFTTSDELPIINAFASQDFPRVSYDENTLVFAAIVESGGVPHLYFATRTNPGSDFGAPGPLNLILDGGQSELTPFLRKALDGTGELWFAQCGRGSSNDCRTAEAGASLDLYRAVIKNPDFDASSPFGGLVRDIDVNENDENESSPVLSADGLEIFFARSGKIFRAWREKTTDRFRGIDQVRSLNVSGNEAPNWLSQDNCRLYLQSQKDSPGEPRKVDLYMAVRSPP